MIHGSVGELAQSLQLRRQNAHLTSELRSLSREVASGEVADKGAALNGDLSVLAEIERSRSALNAHRQANTEAATTAATMQRILGNVAEAVGDNGTALAAAGTPARSAGLSAGAQSAGEALDRALSALNMRVAGKSVFAGTALAVTPFADSAAVLSQARVAVAGATDSSDIMSALDTFFDTPGGGFETTVYRGSAAPPAAMDVAPRHDVRIDLAGGAPAIREALKGLVAGVLIEDPSVAGNTTEQTELARAAGETLLAAEDALNGEAARLGAVEAAIEQAASRNEAETAALDIARADLLGIDPYEKATALKDTEAQLRTLYAVTARLSRLSLTEYLR